MSEVNGAFTVRFLSNGDQVFLTRDIIKIVDGVEKGGSLFQSIDTTSGTLSSDWTISNNQPVVRIMAKSAKGYSVSLNSALWAYDGQTLLFGAADEEGWQTSTNDARFKCKLDATNNCAMLKIVGNIASNTVLSNKQISYTISYTSNAKNDSLSSSVDVIVQQAGSDSHFCQITATHSELNKDITSTDLKVEAFYGAKPVTIGSGGYAVKWFKNGVEISGQTSDTMTLTRDEINGGCIITAKLYKNDTLVAQDGQRINDTADEYQIVVTPTDKNYIDENYNPSYSLVLKKNDVALASQPTFSSEIYNCLGEKKRTSEGATITLTKEDGAYTTNSNKGYSDVDVLVSANY